MQENKKKIFRKLHLIDLNQENKIFKIFYRKIFV